MKVNGTEWYDTEAALGSLCGLGNQSKEGVNVLIKAFTPFVWHGDWPCVSCSHLKAKVAQDCSNSRRTAMDRK